MFEPTMKKYKGDGIQINAAVWEGTGKTIICIHGITANCRTWDVMVSPLVSKHRVIAVDIRGRGRSDKPASGYSLDRHVRDLACVMDDIGIERAVIMGHSLGAYISLYFAAKHPERTEKLILVDGGGRIVSEERANAVLTALAPIHNRLLTTFPSPDAYIEAIKENPHFLPWSPAVEAYFRYEIMDTEGGVKGNIDPVNIQEEKDNLLKEKPEDLYGIIKCDTLILRATEGIFSPDDLVLTEDVTEEMVMGIPHSRRLDLKGNHFGVIFWKNEVRDRAVLSFIEK